MPFVRCKFYTDSGEPVRGGCRRRDAGCAFVHPGTPDWNSAPPPSFRAKDKSGDSGSFKSWGERNRRNSASTSSGWGASRTATNSATETTSGRDRDTGGGWGAGSGWGTGTGWGTDTETRWSPGNGWGEESTSTPNQVPESINPESRATESRDTSVSTSGWGQADTVPTACEHAKSGENGWGGNVDDTTGSGWASTGNAGWGTTGWGNIGNTDKTAGSGWGSSHTDEPGGGWEDKRNTDKGPGSAGENSQRGKNKKAASFDPMIVDNQAEKGTKQKKDKRKAIPAPPRIRIPDNDNRKTKITGTNNEPLGTSKWNIFRPVTASTPVATTPTTVITPTDSMRVKRKRDIAFDDKLDLFKEYVKTWERGVRTRFLLVEAEVRRDRWFRTQKSACYARIGEAGRQKLDGERAECDKEVNSQREKLSNAITSLVDLHDEISSGLDLGQRYNVGGEVETFIVESKIFVDEVRALLVAQVLKDKNDAQSHDTRKHPSAADATPVDTLRDRIRDLEERFDQAHAELTLHRQRDIHSEIEELLTAKIADLRVARQREIERIASLPRAEIVIPPSALMKIEETSQQVKGLDAEVPHTVEDIRVLLLRVDATTKRVNQLEEELSTNKETYRKMQKMTDEKEEIVRRMDERLEKIRDQFGQLVASQSGLSPTTYSREKLLDNLRPALEAVLDKFYEQEVRPVIDAMQQNVVNVSGRLQEEAIQVLWGKIKPAMNMVAEVSRWLDSQELRRTAPTEEDPSARNS